MNNLTLKPTSLSKSVDVLSTLTYKLNALTEDGKDLQSGIADYVGRGLGEVENKLDYLKEVKAEIASEEKRLKEQKQAILEGTAQFVESFGIERLEGTLVSSITITKGKPANTKTKFTLLADKKACDAYLVDAGMAVMEEVEVPATKDKARVNRRKIAVGEIEE